MTSSPSMQTVSIAGKPSKMKALTGLTITKTVKFMGEDLLIRKLMVAEVLEIQNKARDSENNNEDTEGLGVLRKIIRAGCSDAAELTDEDFLQFPLDELTILSNEIMAFSGVGPNTGK